MVQTAHDDPHARDAGTRPLARAHAHVDGNAEEGFLGLSERFRGQRTGGVGDVVRKGSLSSRRASSGCPHWQGEREGRPGSESGTNAAEAGGGGGGSRQDLLLGRSGGSGLDVALHSQQEGHQGRRRAVGRCRWGARCADEVMKLRVDE